MAYSSKRKTTVFESQTWDVLKTPKEDLLSASEKQPVTFCEILKNSQWYHVKVLLHYQSYLLNIFTRHMYRRAFNFNTDEKMCSPN